MGVRVDSRRGGGVDRWMSDGWIERRGTRGK